MTVRGVGRRLLILLVMLALMAGAAFWAFRKVGRWLVDPDPLQHARAIVVLSGRLPFRSMEAAEVYRQGWAPEVWLFHDERWPQLRLLPANTVPLFKVIQQLSTIF